MSDLIDRQELRRAMYHEAMEKDSNEQKWDSGCWIRYKMFERVVDSIPQANQWIPCSEKLPEEDERVLVTDEDGEIEIARYEYNAWAEDPTAEWWDGEYRVFPVAWMPLPEPWKGEENGTAKPV